MLKLLFSVKSLFLETVGTIPEGNDLQSMGGVYQFDKEGPSTLATCASVSYLQCPRQQSVLILWW